MNQTTKKYTEFIFDNFVVVDRNKYIPKDTTHNFLRHFGYKDNKALILEFVEILYIFYSKNYPDSIGDVNKIKEVCIELGITNYNKIIIYFKLKYSDYNLIRQDENTLICNKTKDFNRKQITDATNFIIRNVNDKVELFDIPTVICISSSDVFCFIKCEKISELDKTTNPSLLK